MSEIPSLEPRRFIPFRRADILAMCRLDSALQESDLARFERAATQIEDYFRQDFYKIKQQLKDAYAPFDPDSDTRRLEALEPGPEEPELQQILDAVLERANYEKVTQKGLTRALRSSSLFQVRLYIDLNDFQEALLYTRGATEREEILPEFFGLWKRKVRFINYDRVVLYLRFKDNVDTESALGECAPGSSMLKLFQNVPAADLEMLFPNIRVGMRWTDRLLIAVPALVSGGVVLTTKLGATLVLMGSLIGFWLGTHNEPVAMDKTALLALGAGFAALVGYIIKQISNFRNRKLKYTQALTENLYFKLLDNNAGVFFRILDDAEESECKESLLAYYFLLRAGRPLTAGELDDAIEEWFAQAWNAKVDFEIEDALYKLANLDLAQQENELWHSVPMPLT